jgi:hypothetical protein
VLPAAVSKSEPFGCGKAQASSTSTCIGTTGRRRAGESSVSHWLRMHNRDLSTMPPHARNQNKTRSDRTVPNTLYRYRRTGQRFPSAGLVKIRCIRPGDAEWGAEHYEPSRTKQRGQEVRPVTRKPHQNTSREQKLSRRRTREKNSIAQGMQNWKPSILSRHGRSNEGSKSGP